MKHDHVGILEKVRHELPTDELLCDLSDLFKLFGDTTRIKILYSLFESEMCVCAIGRSAGNDAVGHFASASDFKGCQSCRQPSGGQNGLLFPL